MSCNCNHHEPERLSPKTHKATVKFCDICDPCSEAATNVKICAFVVPTLEEGRYFKNSFVFVQEDDSVYFISDDRSEIPFGSRPKFIEDFDPTATDIKYKSTVVYDVKNSVGYIYDPEGNMVSVSLTTTPFSSLTAGEGIIVTASGGDYTVAIDTSVVASQDDLHTVTLLVTNHTGQINALDGRVTATEGDITNLGTAVEAAQDAADDANELAVEAKTIGEAAQQTATDAATLAATKQDALTAGENITIQNNVISATGQTYSRATTTTNGLMSNEDRKILKNKGVYAPSSVVGTTTTDVSLTYSKNVSNEDGSTYTETAETVTLPSATTSTAGVMSSADKTKLDGIDLSTKQDALIAGDNITIQNNVISADGGGVTVLTAEDKNYPENSPDGIAVWKLPNGHYNGNGQKIYWSTGENGNSPWSGTYSYEFVVTDMYNGIGEVKGIIKMYAGLVSSEGTFNSTTDIFTVNSTTGRATVQDGGADGTDFRGYVLKGKHVVNSLTSTATGQPLSANQGKVLKGLIDALAARVSALEGN